MMAAEVNEPTSVEAPAISSSDAVHKITDNSQNGGSRPPSVTASGSPDDLANKHIADIIDNLVNSAEPSISGGSDTETSRLDANKGRDGEAGHVRASSAARKPATFKTVSVNKTFLAAKAAAGASSAAKPGDTASPVLGSASLSTPSVAGSARPRLVAKTGLVKGINANGRPAAAPEPSTVWNKNQPAPPPEPRKLTDEELKKYGIHVATRLQQDDTKGQANNWADIDDDDEDWAPEEIRWTDGTKSTIPHHEEHQQLSQQQHSTGGLYEIPRHQTQAGPVQPSPMVPKAVISRDAAAAAIAAEKPRSPAPTGIRTGGLPSGKGLIFKNAPEKPTLVAKPPAPPTPVKSPWAQLPPVDRAPPVAADVPPYNSNPRMSYQPPPQHYQHHQHPHRDVYGGPPRGSTPPPRQYKEIAADDFSRSGFRDGHAYQNRELFNSQSGRLEPVGDRRSSFRNDNMPLRQPPSSVLQRASHGHTMDQQAEPSSVYQAHRSSGQEGPYGRRRNSSNVSGGSGSFMRMVRPHDQHVPTELLSARRPSMTGRSDSPASPNLSSSGPQVWQARSSPNTAFAGPYSNAQQGVPSPNPIPVEAVPVNTANVAAVPAVDDVEYQKKLMRERLEAAKKRRVEEDEREEAARRERIRLKLEAMGPAPERKSAKKEAAKSDASASAAAPRAAPITPAQSFSKLNTGDHTPERPATSGVSAHDDGSGGDATGPESQQHGQQTTHEQQQQPWQGSAPRQTERIASWGSSNQSMRNVWGSPNNRSLGNGTFITDLGRASDPYAQGAPKGGPGPIGPPPPAPIGPPKIAALVSAPTAGQGPRTSPPTAAASANVTRSAWANAVKANDESLLLQQKAHRAEQQREAESRGLTLNDIRPTIKDTWMPTRLNEDGSRVEDMASQSVVHRSGTTVSVTAAGPIHPQQARPSRFFPARDARADDTHVSGSPVASSSSMPSNGAHDRHGSPSPPPPDMDGHPVFDGDASHPLVSLPRPQIVVRLPPKGGSSSGNEPLYSHHAQTRLTGHGSSEDGHWQAKFDSLLKLGSGGTGGKTAASPARPDVHSRHPIDITSPTRSPTALYTAPRGPHVRDLHTKATPKEPIMTRLMAEECFERQEMGSLPPVHLPNKAPELAWTPAPAPKSVPRRFQVAAMTSTDYESVVQDLFSPPHSVNIHLPGMAGNGKVVSLPTPRSLSNRSLSNSRRSGYSRSGGRSSRGGSNKSRGDTASTHSGSHGNDSGPAPGSSHGSSGGGRGRGGTRHRLENWSRGGKSSST